MTGSDHPASPAQVLPALPGHPPAGRRWWPRLLPLAVWGPGLLVMLADTDAGSLITAAQSGARWGYRMLAPQLVLIPVLYVVQEMTVRLGLVTGKGHGALIRERFGSGWAAVSSLTLFSSAIGALVTELAGVAGVGQLYGAAPWVTVPAATAFLIGLAFAGGYRRVERIGIAIGLAELAIVPVAVLAHPDPGRLLHGLANVPLASGSYDFLLAANVGAVIMPWMVFYQQGAVVDKGIRLADLGKARRDTAAGAVLTQGIMLLMVAVVAATLGRRDPGVPLSTVGQISGALTGVLGGLSGRVLFSLVILGAAMAAALVSSLAAAWGLAEVFGWKHTLNERPGRRTAKFYLAYTLAHLAGAGLVLASVDLIGLAVDAEVMNALLLPVVLGFLLVLEARALPPEFRMRGWHRHLTWILCLLVIGFGLYMVPAVLAWH